MLPSLNTKPLFPISFGVPVPSDKPKEKRDRKKQIFYYHSRGQKWHGLILNTLCPRTSSRNFTSRDNKSSSKLRLRLRQEQDGGEAGVEISAIVFVHKTSSACATELRKI